MSANNWPRSRSVPSAGIRRRRQRATRQLDHNSPLRVRPSGLEIEYGSVEVEGVGLRLGRQHSEPDDVLRTQAGEFLHMGTAASPVRLSACQSGCEVLIWMVRRCPS